MIKFPLYNIKAEKIEDISLDSKSDASKLNKKLISQVLRVEENHIRTKNGKAKTRAEVSGGGRKPFKQKGTGRARAGSNRSPIWKGGGVTFGPTGISKVLRIPARMRALAMLQLVNFNKKNIAVVDDFSLKTAKTKDAAEFVGKLAAGQRAMIIASVDESEIVRPYRNILSVELHSTNNLLITDLLKKRMFLFSKKSFEELSARLKNV
jgi:large subunit ribosomal protein L4